ncbi:MAG: methyltransferase domain-containing protein [Actinophytocola sp.]|uniref:class I SAM-dependent methyltransferase n=1 Tax=Actinophytocola sp. TaxID=1872138 RepID=UPI00132082E9|nr:class I SAM-dependent methyltransferase [Actinophytocola sp.]MPZ81653.1 methyltransferase domain-containing protein [Actinophytocola sp.]
MAHTHDGIDWTERLAGLRRADERDAEPNLRTAERLVDLVSSGGSPPVVMDIGSGAGGMSIAFATALAARGGGRVVLADAVDVLLSAAVESTRAAAGDSVQVESVHIDAADENLPDVLPAADLVWASRVVHHLPDQQKAIDRLAQVLAPGGWLALSEGGLATRCLPWDLGIGEPGLGSRLTAAGDAWFVQMRAEMPGSVSLPVGWTSALAAAGLVDTTSFSFLIDLPAPVPEKVRLSVVDWLAWMSGVGEDALSESDRQVVQRLLDPDDEAYVARRDDVFVLGASTVHLGRRDA